MGAAASTDIAAATSSEAPTSAAAAWVQSPEISAFGSITEKAMTVLARFPSVEKMYIRITLSEAATAAAQAWHAPASMGSVKASDNKWVIDIIDANGAVLFATSTHLDGRWLKQPLDQAIVGPAMRAAFGPAGLGATSSASSFTVTVNKAPLNEQKLQFLAKWHIAEHPNEKLHVEIQLTQEASSAAHAALARSSKPRIHASDKWVVDIVNSEGVTLSSSTAHLDLRGLRKPLHESLISPALTAIGLASVNVFDDVTVSINGASTHDAPTKSDPPQQDTSECRRNWTPSSPPESPAQFRPRHQVASPMAPEMISPNAKTVRPQGS